MIYVMIETRRTEATGMSLAHKGRSRGCLEGDRLSVVTLFSRRTTLGRGRGRGIAYDPLVLSVLWLCGRRCPWWQGWLSSIRSGCLGNFLKGRVLGRHFIWEELAESSARARWVTASTGDVIAGSWTALSSSFTQTKSLSSPCPAPCSLRLLP